MSNPLVLIITLNYNQSRMTIDCVNSIINSGYNNYKIIVVDNGSIKEELEYLLSNINSCVFVKEVQNNRGYVGGINIGFKEAEKYHPDYFMIMNNDTILDDQAIENLVDSGERFNRNAIISGKVYHFDKPNTIQYIGSIFSDRRYLKEIYPYKNEEDVGQCDVEKEMDMLDDIFWLIPNKIFNEVGFYSDNFFIYSEQGDYALRAVRKKFKLIYNPNAKIWHKGSITTGNGDGFSPVVNFWRFKGGLIYLYRNTKKKFFYFKLIKTLPKLLLKNIFNFIGIRKSENKKSDYAALIGYIYGIKWIFNKKPDTGYNPFIK